MWSSGAKVAPAPEDRIHPLRGGETPRASGCVHARPDASDEDGSYLNEENGDADAGDAAGVRIWPDGAHGALDAPAGHRRGGLADSLHDRLLQAAAAARPRDVADDIHRVALGAERSRPPTGAPRRGGALHRGAQEGIRQNTDPATVEAFEQAIPPDQAYMWASPTGASERNDRYC